MYAGSDFDPIDVGETVTLTFDFAKGLGTGETIQSVVWSCAVAEGTDAAPSSRLHGSASIVGTQTLQQVSTMLAGVKYRLAALATTSTGQVLDLFAFALCQDPAGVT